jgi:transposase
MGKAKEISQDLKTIVDLHKSGSSLGAIAKRLKVPRSTVQTIVRKYKHHGTTQPSYHSGNRRVLSPRDEHTLLRKGQISPRTTAKDLVKMLGETGTKVSMPTVKRVLYRHNLKVHSARKKPQLQNHLKKARLWHGDKYHTFWRNVLWSDETRNRTVWPKLQSLCLEEKGGGLQAEEYHPNREARESQHHVVGVLSCRREWCTLKKIDGIMRKGKLWTY